MNPFLEIPIIISGNEVKQKGKGLFAKPEYLIERKEVTLRARPGEFESYHAGIRGGTVIRMKSGGEYISTWSFDEMDTAITSYNDTINAKDNKGRFGNVVIKPRQKPDEVALKPEPKLEKV